MKKSVKNKAWLSKGLVLTVLSVLVLPTQVIAKDWNQSLAINGVAGLHSSSSNKDSQVSSAITWDKTYLEQYGYGVNFQYLNAPFSAGDALSQFQLRGSYWKLLTPDHFAFKIVPSADVYYISNNDTTGNSDNVLASSFSAAFVALDNSYSVTPSFSYSTYDGKFSVTQIDVAGGFSYDNQWANLSYKPSIINVSDASISGNNQYVSHKITSSHFIKQPDNFYNVSSISASLSAGDKAFGIDTAAKSLYNLSDVSQYALSLDIAFKPKSQSQWLLGAGFESFNDVSASNTYSLLYGYVQYVKYW